MTKTIIVAGGGMAGLTAAAYLCRAGANVTLFEKEAKVGGLVNSFERGGYVWDGGIRAIENSGIVAPMLKQLGIEVEFLPSQVSVGFGSELTRLGSRQSLADYRELLCRIFPANRADIEAIVAEIAKVMDYLDVLYGIDNPLFLDTMTDPGYVFRTLLPWLFKYIRTMPKVAKLHGPVDEYLERFTSNRALVDLLAQHFFRKTPTYFALSYFTLYLDYRYPKGGTGSLSAALERYILEKGGTIRTGLSIAKIIPRDRIAGAHGKGGAGGDSGGRVVDSSGAGHSYDGLVWAADQKALYRSLDLSALGDDDATARVRAKAADIAGKRGGDSIFTLCLAVGLEPSWFAERASPHLFYTPSLEGLHAMDIAGLEAWGRQTGLEGAGKEEIFALAMRYLDLTTFEISFPVLRDPSMAPAGKTGAIVSSLMDYDVVRRIADEGWYEEFKEAASRQIIGILNGSVFPGLAAAVEDRFVSTPLSIERYTGNADGAITGWAFTNDGMPAVHDLPKVARSVQTPIPGVWQAGQWTFSPSGLPISSLTGKLAADAILAAAKKGRL
ncbi:NAD(P)/FAD-dependent oxidoreductase [bacterium]|nr:NAD(P)/FAD-dependent oxidoreductase [bacterium]